eukprot:scaffold23_cov113-Isochrysis_galbana.AAC.15
MAAHPFGLGPLPLRLGLGHPRRLVRRQQPNRRSLPLPLPLLRRRRRRALHPPASLAQLGTARGLGAHLSADSRSGVNTSRTSCPPVHRHLCLRRLRSQRQSVGRRFFNQTSPGPFSPTRPIYRASPASQQPAAPEPIHPPPGPPWPLAPPPPLPWLPAPVPPRAARSDLPPISLPALPLPPVPPALQLAAQPPPTFLVAEPPFDAQPLGFGSRKSRAEPGAKT